MPYGRPEVDYVGMAAKAASDKVAKRSNGYPASKLIEGFGVDVRLREMGMSLSGNVTRDLDLMRAALEMPKGDGREIAIYRIKTLATARDARVRSGGILFGSPLDIREFEVCRPIEEGITGLVELEGMEKIWVLCDWAEGFGRGDLVTGWLAFSWDRRADELMTLVRPGHLPRWWRES